MKSNFLFKFLFIPILIFQAKELVDESTLSNYQEIHLVHLSGIFEPDFKEKIVKGNLIYDFESIEDGDEIILDTKYLNITSIKNSKTDENISFIFGEETENLGKPLIINFPFKKNDNISLNIIFNTTKEGSSAQFLTKEQTRTKKYEYLFTISALILGRQLLPSQDTPSIKFTFHLGIKVPEEIRGLMSGLFSHVDYNKEENTKTFYYEQKIPIPNYLLSLAAGEIENINITNSNISIFADPGYINDVVKELNELPKILKIAEEYLGPYEWGKYNVLVLPPSFPYSGVENPCLTFCSPCLINGDGSLVDIVVHELIHSWSGNLVTNGNWSDFWLNEGITMFLQRKIVGRWKEDQDYAKMDGLLGLFYINFYLDYFGIDSTFTCLRPNFTGLSPDDFFSDIPYEKGYNFIYYIENLIGEDMIEQFFKSYFQKFKYKSIFLEDFKKYLIEFCESKGVANETLNEIDWDKWIYSPGKCPFENNLTNKYSKEVDEAYEKFIKSELDDNLAQQILKWSHTSKTVFMNMLKEDKKFLSDEQHEFFTKKMNFLEGQDFLVQTNFYRLILSSTDKFYSGEKEGLIKYLSTYGALDYMAGVYELFYKRDEELAIQTLDNLRGFYHNLMISNAEEEMEIAKSTFPIIKLDLSEDNNNKCICLTYNSSLDIITNDYENITSQPINITDGVILQSEDNKSIKLDCFLKSEEKYCLIKNKEFSSGIYYLIVPDRIQKMEYAIKALKGKNIIKIKTYEEVEIDEDKMNETNYKINYNNKKSQNIKIYFINQIDDSIKVTSDEKTVRCSLNEKIILDCVIDSNSFPYNKDRPEDYVNYELQLKDLCGEELYAFNISVSNIVEDDDDDGIGTGLIVVIILGSVFILIVISFLIYRVVKRNKKDDIEDMSNKKLLSDMQN